MRNKQNVKLNTSCSPRKMDKLLTIFRPLFLLFFFLLNYCDWGSGACGATLLYNFKTSVKTTDFQLVFNVKQTPTVTIIGEHGIMAHIP